MSTIVKKLSVVCLVLALLVAFVLLSRIIDERWQNYEAALPPNNRHSEFLADYNLPEFFEHEANYEVEVKTNINSIIEGNVRNGFAVKVEAGDVIDVLTKVNGSIMDSANDIWFIIADVNFGTYTAADFGYKIACDYRTKWLNVPDDATGVFTILVEDTRYGRIITMLEVTVIPALTPGA